MRSRSRMATGDFVFEFQYFVNRGPEQARTGFAGIVSSPLVAMRSQSQQQPLWRRQLKQRSSGECFGGKHPARARCTLEKKKEENKVKRKSRVVECPSASCFLRRYWPLLSSPQE